MFSCSLALCRDNFKVFHDADTDEAIFFSHPTDDPTKPEEKGVKRSSGFLYAAHYACHTIPGESYDMK